MTLIELSTSVKRQSPQKNSQILSISRRFVYEHAKAGRMPSFKIGEAVGSIQRQMLIGCRKRI